MSGKETGREEAGRWWGDRHVCVCVGSVRTALHTEMKPGKVFCEFRTQVFPSIFFFPTYPDNI